MESTPRIDPDIEQRMRAAALPGQATELERLNMVPLRGATSERWVRHALANLNELLDDHCQCELKAASNALALIGRNPNREKLVQHLAGLCREEMRHYRQVRDVLQTRGGTLTRPMPSPYLKAVNRERMGSEHALLDDLMVAALVEARSCERFVSLAWGLREFAPDVPQAEDLAALYAGLAQSESGHAFLFVELAREYYPTDLVETELTRRVVIEENALREIPITARMHGGNGPRA